MSSLKTKLRALVLAAVGLAAATAARAEDLVVTHYASLLYGTPYSVALDKGYFKEAGVDVTGILTSKGGGTSVRNMMAGDTLFAEVALPAALSAIKEGFPIKIISGGTDGSSGFWVTRPGEVINKPEDLKGKRFVFSRPKSVSESIILAILKSYNIDPSEVKMVAIGDFGAGLTALEHNKADIAIIPEPIYSMKMKEGAKYQVIPWLDAKIPAYTQTVGIATDETIAKKGDKLRAIIEARRKGVDFLYANPKEAAAILAKAYNLEPDVAASALANTLKQNSDLVESRRAELPADGGDGRGAGFGGRPAAADRLEGGDRRALPADRPQDEDPMMAGPAVSLVRPAPMDHAVHARLTDVTRIYPARAGQAAVHALGPLSMELRAGEFFSVVGPSGCGKSTLLDVLAGLALPSAGTVEFEGKPVHGRCPTASASSSRKMRASPGSRSRTMSPSASAARASKPPRRRRRVDFAVGFMGLRDFRRRLSQPALRRHAPARLHRAHPRPAAAPDPARRAVRRARPADPPADGRRAFAPVARDLCHGAADHPRPRRGQPAV